MVTPARKLWYGVVLALAVPALAQDPPADSTIEQRLAALEAGLATLDTRLGLATSRPPDLAGQSDLALAGRITALERTVERLAADVQRVERLADNASRAAAQAQRDAMNAERAARDAAMRAR